MFLKFFTILLFIPFYSFSQNNFVFQHLTVEDGLISNPLVNIFQDAEGFYWFSAVNGIQRFDGKNFITYLYPDNLTVNRSGEWTGTPLEDNDKNLWILNDDGINIYQRNHQKITRLYMSDADDSNENNVVSLIKDEQNNIWIITGKNIFKYNYASGKPVLFCNITSDVHLGIARVTYDKNRNIFWLLISEKDGLI
ncbi:MAG: two-component regulator propeller domain-containing protein, partial [Ferruginibacter sp.]